jgi:hypothetical protein
MFRTPGAHQNCYKYLLLAEVGCQCQGSLYGPEVQQQAGHGHFSGGWLLACQIEGGIL